MAKCASSSLFRFHSLFVHLLFSTAQVLDLIKKWADDEAKCREAERKKGEGEEDGGWRLGDVRCAIGGQGMSS